MMNMMNQGVLYVEHDANDCNISIQICKRKFARVRLMGLRFLGREICGEKLVVRQW